jgi:hypothetical protein
MDETVGAVCDSLLLSQVENLALVYESAFSEVLSAKTGYLPDFPSRPFLLQLVSRTSHVLSLGIRILLEGSRVC